MKKFNKISVLFLSVVALSGCSLIQGKTVVVDENENKVKKPVNLSIQYIVVDKEDKESLIKNIKSGKGPIITRDRYEDKNNSNDGSNDDNNSNN